MSDITLKEIDEIYKKANAYDKFKSWLEYEMTPKTNVFGDTGYAYMIKCDILMEKLNEFMNNDVEKCEDGGEKAWENVKN